MSDQNLNHPSLLERSDASSLKEGYRFKLKCSTSILRVFLVTDKTVHAYDAVYDRFIRIDIDPLIKQLPVYIISFNEPDKSSILDSSLASRFMLKTG